MEDHTEFVDLMLPDVSHEPSNRVQVRNDQEARQYVAALAALALERVPASYIEQRSPVDRSLRTIHGWREPALVSGLRAHDLLLVPKPAARIFLRGMVAVVDGAPPPDGPSRLSLAQLFGRIASLLLITTTENPESMPDEILRERQRMFDENEEALRRARASYDREALRRKRVASLPSSSNKDR